MGEKWNWVCSLGVVWIVTSGCSEGGRIVSGGGGGGHHDIRAVSVARLLSS